MTGFMQEDADRAERAAGNPYVPLDWSLSAILEKLAAERCAPLVEALELIERSLFVVSTLDEARLVARAALAAYHAAQGAGRGT